MRFEYLRRVPREAAKLKNTVLRKSKHPEGVSGDPETPLERALSEEFIDTLHFDAVRHTYCGCGECAKRAMTIATTIHFGDPPKKRDDAVLEEISVYEQLAHMGRQLGPKIRLWASKEAPRSRAVRGSK